MKKVFLSLMAVAAIALTGCKPKTIEPEMEDETIPLPSILRPEEIVGRGYNATQDYAREEYVASPVLSIPKLLERGLIADVVEPRVGTQTVTYGSTLVEYQKKLSGKLGIDVEVFGFSAACHGNFSITSTDKYAYSYLTGRYCYKRYIYKIKASPVEDLIPCLTDEFVADVNRLSTADLVRRYGTHVINGLSTGGVIEYNTSAERAENENEDDFSAGLTAGYDGLFKGKRSAEVSMSKEFKKNHSECEERMICRGGDSHLIMAAYDSASIENNALFTWCNSITDNSKSVMVDFEGPEGSDKGCLIPLYEFIQDEGKKTEVRNYILDRMANPWKEKGSKSLVVYLRKLVNYYDGKSSRNFYRFRIIVVGPAQYDYLFNTYSNDPNVTGGGLPNNCINFIHKDKNHWTRTLDFTDKNTAENMDYKSAEKRERHFRWGEPKTEKIDIPSTGNPTFTIYIDSFASRNDPVKTFDSIVFTRVPGENKWKYVKDKEDHYLVDRNVAKENDNERFCSTRFYLQTATQDWLEFYFEIEEKERE